MGATIAKIKSEQKKVIRKPLSSLQIKLLAGPVMTTEEYNEYKKVNKWMAKWKI